MSWFAKAGEPKAKFFFLFFLPPLSLSSLFLQDRRKGEGSKMDAELSDLSCGKNTTEAEKDGRDQYVQPLATVFFFLLLFFKNMFLFLSLLLFFLSRSNLPFFFVVVYLIHLRSNLTTSAAVVIGRCCHISYLVGIA